ncbi:MAG: hypothetical protein AB8G17_04345 [Gammaproteobacteria bacterium]
MSAQAQAALLTFNLGWSGESFSNTAVATAVLVVDDTLLPNPGSTGDNGQAVLLAELGIVSFDMVVTGATIGDGAYSIDTFAAVTWNSGALGLDLSTELVGQATDGNPWGTSDGFSGDFNVFSLDGFSPSGTFFYQLTTAGGFGDNMLLTNFTPVPIGPALPLLVSAVGALGLLRRPRRQ